MQQLNVRHPVAGDDDAPCELDAAARAALLDEVARIGRRGGPQDLPAVLSRARVGVLHRDLSGRVLTVNERFCELVGRSAAELEELPFEQLIHPEDVERSRSLYWARFATREPFEIEKRYLRPDGSSLWCAVHVSFVLGADGRPISTITVATDVTARREAERELRESEEHYRHTVELNPQISWTAAPDGSIDSASPRWYEITGVPVEVALGEQWLSTLHPDDVPHTRDAWSRGVETGTPVDIEYRLLARDGTYRWFRARAAPRFDQMGAILRWYGTLEDIHDRKTAEDALRDSEERFRLAAEAAGLGIWDYDATRDQREWSDGFKAMLGLPPSAEPGVAAAIERVVPEDRHLLQALVDAAQAGDSSARFEVTLRVHRADTGEERWMRTAGWRMHASSGRLARVLVTIRDVTEERTADERVRWTATHDALTGLANRPCFNDQLEAAIARAGAARTDLALVLLDVDHLKELNDTVGHDAGDMLLCTFAERLRAAFGPEALIGRLGGDEFAVALEGLSRDEAMRRMTEALAAMREPFEYDGHSCDTQATAGASLFPEDGRSGTELMKAADIALYVGKGSRRGSLSMFTSAMRAGLQRRSSMLNVARAAVRDDRVVPFYQPKVTLADGRVTGFEALLRWRHPTLGIQAPETIAAAFDDLNLAIALSDRMLERIAADMRRWLDRGLHPGRVAINLSSPEFRQDQLAARVLGPFSCHGIPTSMIELEITETVLLGRDTERVAATLAAFHREGVRIALDDFGTGFASLTHLKSFPVDVIKIDRSFVANLCEGSGDAAIVDAIVGLAHRLKMEVVAEGVEDERQARYLVGQGCTYAQGYLYGKAMPAHEVEALLARKC